MAEHNESEWIGFNRAAVGRGPRELLARTLNFFAVERHAPGVAVDLCCGSGPDTLELLRRGWTVHAVDSDARSLDLLLSLVPEHQKQRLHVHESRIEAFLFPPCEFVWAGFALPFCPRAEWHPLLQRVKVALRVGGRVAGDMFGDEHAWAHESEVLTRSESQLRADLQGLEVEAFDIENGYRVSGEVTRWHAFGFAARKPAVLQ